MTLLPGTTLGSYEVIAPLGAGGMGEVYRARDAQLKREVALKVLPAAVAGDADRLARFQREAELLASLNHPHIAQIYGVAEADGVRALVMELVEGPTLAERIADGPMPWAEAQLIAQQLAEALDEAHQRGVVHRDLKPANIKLTPDGSVKVLDFGLAKALGAPGAGDPRAGSDRANSPTMTSPAMTQAGVILGTAAYMSPEQARGRAVDKRTDIWAYGVVLYELLTGRSAFPGETVTDVIAAIVHKEPDWRRLPADVPARVRTLLQRCLQKDPRARLRDIGDVQTESAAGEGTVAEPGITAGRQRRPGRMIALVSGALLTVGLLGYLAGLSGRSGTQSDRSTIWAYLPVTPASALDSGGVGRILLPAGGTRTAMTWSPMGDALAFIGVRDGTRQIFLRHLGRDVATPVAGTEGAMALAFSPDGLSVAFWRRGEMFRVGLSGGPVARVCDASLVTGIAWSTRGIFFSTTNSLHFVPAAGGEAVAITPSDATGLVRTSTPHVLPDASAVLFTEYSKSWTSGDQRVMALRLDSTGHPQGQPLEVLRSAADARYVEPGLLAYISEGTLFVAPLDLRLLTVDVDRKTAVLDSIVSADMAFNSNDLTHNGQFAISRTGTVAFVRALAPLYPVSRLVAIDRRGSVTPVIGPERSFSTNMSLSRDRRSMAMSVYSRGEVQPYLYDLTRGSLQALVRFPGLEAYSPKWLPDGRISVRVVESHRDYVAIIRPDSAGTFDEVPDSAGVWPLSWSPALTLAGSRGNRLWGLSLGDAKAGWRQLGQEGAMETHAAWSPDGRWLAYVSDRSTRQEVYVRAYPDAVREVIVSVRGGSDPAWSPDGEELYFIEPISGANKTRMMAVDMSDPTQPGRPQMLFDFDPLDLPLGGTPATGYVVASRSLFYGLQRQPQPSQAVGRIEVLSGALQEVLKGRGAQ